MSNSQYSYTKYDDYAQSANTLFHFMSKPHYLTDILSRSAIVPRYCIETVDYLNLIVGDNKFDNIAVLQKCFCDIPLHKLSTNFPLHGVGESFNSLNEEDINKLKSRNTHFDYYGCYGIAFSKSWAENKNLQPVHYLNSSSPYAQEFSELFAKLLSKKHLEPEYAQDLLNRLAFFKPLSGIMQRTIERSDSSKITIDIFKNFHDECEWRYVPSTSALLKHSMRNIIANESILHSRENINTQLCTNKYEDLWLKFSYDDIKYLIVPDSEARMHLINYIMSLDVTHFNPDISVDSQKYILISKIMVLNDIRKDW